MWCPKNHTYFWEFSDGVGEVLGNKSSSKTATSLSNWSFIKRISSRTSTNSSVSFSTKLGGILRLIVLLLCLVLIGEVIGKVYALWRLDKVRFSGFSTMISGWKIKSYKIWAWVIRKYFNSDFRCQNLILQTWNWKLIKKTWSLGSQKSLKVPFVSVMMILIFFLNGFVKAYQ